MLSELPLERQINLLRYEKDTSKWLKVPAKLDETGVLVPDFGEIEVPSTYFCEETEDRKWFYVVVIKDAVINNTQ
jgi:hypothetical protein